jgi:hypothetical protein
MKKLIFCLILLAISIWGFQALAEMSAEPYPTYTQDPITITTAELKQANFTDAMQLIISQSNMYYHNFYFLVNETGNSENLEAWGKNANMVAVFFRPLPLGHGNKIDTIEYREYSGRIQAYIYRTNYYLVVTGPDKEKVTGLLNVIYDILS